MEKIKITKEHTDELLKELGDRGFEVLDIMHDNEGEIGEEYFYEVVECVIERVGKFHKGELDYCNNCNAYIDQIDLGDGSFGCPHCKGYNINTCYGGDN